MRARKSETKEPAGSALERAWVDAQEAPGGLRPKYGGLIRLAEALKVHDDESQEKAAGYLSGLKDQRRIVDEKRKEFSGPFDRAANAINAAFRPLLDELDAAIRTLSGKFTSYIQVEQRRRDALLDDQRRREREAQERAEASGQPVTVLPKPPPAPVARTVATGTGTVGVRRQLAFEVVDAAAVPEEFKVVDRGLVMARLRAVEKVAGRVGESEIPGIRSYYDLGVQSR